MTDPPRCPQPHCAHHEAEPHPCPAEDEREDFRCTCCKECTEECADELED